MAIVSHVCIAHTSFVEPVPLALVPVLTIQGKNAGFIPNSIAEAIRFFQMSLQFQLVCQLLYYVWWFLLFSLESSWDSINAPRAILMVRPHFKGQIPPGLFCDHCRLHIIASFTSSSCPTFCTMGRIRLFFKFELAFSVCRVCGPERSIFGDEACGYKHSLSGDGHCLSVRSFCATQCRVCLSWWGVPGPQRLCRRAGGVPSKEQLNWNKSSFSRQYSGARRWRHPCCC